VTERIEQKLTEVAVAQFGYRHEAEFAAGFLEDASIPFRLQIDDPAMGISVSGSATIWVRGMDVDRAREVLDVQDGEAGRSLYAKRGQDQGGQPESMSANVGTGSPESCRAAPPHPRAESIEPRANAQLAAWPALGIRERTVVLVGAAGALSVVWLFRAGPDSLLRVLAAATAVGLSALALLGRAPRFLRDLFRALSGGAP